MRLSISRFNFAAARSGFPTRNDAPTMNGAMTSADTISVRSNWAIRTAITTVVNNAWPGAKTSVSIT